MLRLFITSVITSVAVSTGLAPIATPAPAAAPPPRAQTLVVDDDGAQCSRAGYTSIQAAVDAARPGDRVSVCPGRYVERVVVDKSLRLVGRPDAVAGLDCFAEAPSDAADLDPAVVPILEGPPDAETTVLRIAADGVEVAGLVVQGVDDREPEVVDGFTLFEAALSADDAHAGWRIHHNLLRLNFVAAELGSDGDRPSRFDHNCLRDNAFAVANQRYHLAGARLDHDETFRSSSVGYEIGWGYRGTTGVTLDHLVSVRDGLAVRAEDNDGLVVRDSTIRQASAGILLAGGDTGTRLVDNTVTGTTSGAAVTVAPASADAAPVTGLVVRGNTLSTNGFSGFTTGAFARLTGALIADNTASGNVRNGISLAPGSAGNRVVDNVADGNGQVGIRLLPGTSDNRLVDNRALGNVLADVADDTTVGSGDAVALANRWVDTTCLVDLPAGAIC